MTLTYKAAGYVNRGIILWINSHCASHAIVLSTCLLSLEMDWESQQEKPFWIQGSRMVSLLVLVFMCTALCQHPTEALKTCQTGQVSSLKSIIESSQSWALPNKHSSLLNFPRLHLNCMCSSLMDLSYYKWLTSKISSSWFLLCDSFSSSS